ncbi:MAG TPA: glycoside hydrolase family 3 N-terminal domain-containing protein, partial [Thermoanaerobaculia bacterium]|nr:glycoside hydrolase family 3 N-terminal domain-containing protein [Thermoanaerobaculia bacterium]
EVTKRGTMPATLSRRVVDVLRRDLGFQGLVVTDAMDMGGLAAHFDPGEAAVRALEAGVDQVLFSPDTDAAIAAVREAVRGGRISVPVERGPLRAPKRPAAEAAAAPLDAIAERSIALVRDREHLLPLATNNIRIVTVSPHDDPLDTALRELPPSREDGELLVLLLALRPKSGAGAITVPEEIKALASHNKTIAVAFGSPYILRELGDVSTFVCAWGVQPVLQRAAIRAILGRAPMPGRLPVTV